MNNKIVLSSLALDLKRAAIGYNRGSEKMAQKFLDEAIKRKNEVDESSVKSYIGRLLEKVDLLGRNKNPNRIAEDALMLSTLFQNASLTA